MVTRALGLGIAIGMLWPLAALAAEEPIGRQVQAWRPRPLAPYVPEPRPKPPAEKPAPPPIWQAWVTRMLSGQPVILVQPSWKGAWPLEENPWSLRFTPSLRGHPTAGFGPEAALDGTWSLAGFDLTGHTTVLWTGSNGVASWRTGLQRGGWSIEWRGWMDGNLTLGELAATAAFRRAF